jgi:hypothetical protein
MPSLYSSMPQSPMAWPEPMETIYQMLGREPALPARFKRRELGLSARLYIAAVGNLPPDERPWGSMTWLSDVFDISRPTVYQIAAQLRQQWLEPVGAGLQPAPSAAATPKATRTQVSERRIKRTLLTLALPGNVALRPMQSVLQAAFDESRSLGFISELLTSAGQQAGRVLAGLNYRSLGRVIALRDETFFQGWPILFLVEPRSGVILLGHVAKDRSAETWGAALLVAQDTGVELAGLVEDMGRTFPPSLQAAGLSLAVQKDPWHILDWAKRVRRDLERVALTALASVYRLEDQLAQTWDSPCFDTDYVPAVAKCEGLMTQHDTFLRWQAHLGDALEMVDWRAGEIRDPASNAWLLDETLKALAALAHPSVRKFVKSLRRYRTQLLTYLDWLAVGLAPWRQRLAANVPTPAAQVCFERTVARAWRLRQGVINGQHWQRLAHEATDLVARLVADQPAYRQLAADLTALLDGTPHASSLIETINGIVKTFLQARQALRNPETAQAYLNLLVLWHNMRSFQRGKRAGQSPFQWAKITPESDDWLTLLGYPAA